MERLASAALVRMAACFLRAALAQAPAFPTAIHILLPPLQFIQEISLNRAQALAKQQHDNALHQSQIAQKENEMRQFSLGEEVLIAAPTLRFDSTEIYRRSAEWCFSASHRFFNGIARYRIKECEANDDLIAVQSGWWPGSSAKTTAATASRWLYDTAPTASEAQQARDLRQSQHALTIKPGTCSSNSLVARDSGLRLDPRTGSIGGVCKEFRACGARDRSAHPAGWRRSCARL